MRWTDHPLFLGRPAPARIDAGWLILLNFVVALGYGITGYAGLQLAIVGNSVTLFWAPSGIAFAVVWLCGIRVAPGVALGALIVNLTTLHSPVAAAVMALGNTLPSVVARLWLLRIIDRRRETGGLGELERVALFIGIAGLATTMISATLGTIAIAAIAQQEPLSATTWFIWWMGDAAGVIVVAPPLLVWRRVLGARPGWQQMGEIAAIGLALAAVVASLRIIDEPIWAVEVCKLLCLLTGILAAVRFGLTGAVLSSLFIALGAIDATIDGSGPFVRGGLVSSYAMLHSFLLIAAVVSALLAAALADLHRLVAKSTLASKLAVEADLAKSRLLAAASHDLRQPINALKLSLDVLARDLAGHGETRSLNHARTAARSAADMLDTLLDFSRAEAGRVVPQPRHFALQTVFANLEDEFGPEADAKQLVYRTRETTAVIDADPVLVELILRNLIGNALRYTTSGGVLVAARLRSKQVIVEVHDTGIGIARQDLAKIFDEFFQVRHGAPEGHGLGLAIAARFAKDLGSQITVRSRLGSGSTFAFVLTRAT